MKVRIALTAAQEKRLSRVGLAVERKAAEIVIPKPSPPQRDARTTKERRAIKHPID